MWPQAVSLTLNGSRPPSPQILAALGLERGTRTSVVTRTYKRMQPAGQPPEQKPKGTARRREG
jgi:hypothetical protein